MFHSKTLIALAVVVAAVQARSNPSWREQCESDWLRQDAKRLAPESNPTREQDAAGAVDGIKNGNWGFHTDSEPNPWWQVDLGTVTALDRVVVYNRCDGMAGRNSKIIIGLSDDGVTFRSVYQHNGVVFFGATDGKPLTVPLKGAQGRFVRLSLSSHDYLHLDEVEVYPEGKNQNIALGKLATQSSTSQWSARHIKNEKPDYPVELVLSRGLKLVENLRQQGLNVDATAGTLQHVADLQKALGKVGVEGERRSLYFQAHWAVRELEMRNPLLRFDTLLFVKRAPGMFPHMSDQAYGWWSRPGGGIFLLEKFKSDSPQERCLTADMPRGSFVGPDLSFDGRKVLFAYCKYCPPLANEPNKSDKARVPEDAFYHIYEMNIDGSNRRQLTFGKYDDFDARYLPNDGIVFDSTRKGTAIQCTQWFSDNTRTATHVDSYVRCGGDNYRPVPVFTLHAMNADGHNIRPMSAFENFEWTPSVANDGRVLYTRWDYIDRFNGNFFSLWSANQDGSNPQLVYGNYTAVPQVKIEARAIPNSSKLVFTASAHHSIYGGAICLLDPTRGSEGDVPLTRLTPEVHYPETQANDDHYYAHPWPLSEEFFLVGWADAKLPPHGRYENDQNPVNAMGLYLLDAFGNQELLCRDASISSVSPIPVAPRQKPAAFGGVVQWNGAPEGQVLVQDVYSGLDGIPRGTVKQLRLVAVPPKVQPQMNNPVLGVSAEDPGKFVLGTVPVEADGSAFFCIPSGLPVFFQALDTNNTAVQTMRTLTYAMPGQTLSCIGCHESRAAAPAVGHRSQALARPASHITAGPEGSWPLRFDRLIQPVLDGQCVACHRPGSKDTLAAKLDLTPAHAYQTLLDFGDTDLRKQAFERDRSIPAHAVAANTRLWKLLTQPGGHQKLTLNRESLDRFAVWMDTYAHNVGHFSEAQEKELLALRRDLSAIMIETPK